MNNWYVVEHVSGHFRTFSPETRGPYMMVDRLFSDFDGRTRDGVSVLIWFGTFVYWIRSVVGTSILSYRRNFFFSFWLRTSNDIVTSSFNYLACDNFILPCTSRVGAVWKLYYLTKLCTLFHECKVCWKWQWIIYHFEVKEDHG